MAFHRPIKALVLGQMSELHKSIGTAFILRTFGAGLAFVLNFAIVRLLGASGAGLYFLSMSVIAVVAVVARLGLENTVLRFVASFHEEGDFGQVRGVMRYALIRSGSISLALAVLIVVLSPIFENYIFNAPGLAPVLATSAFTVLAYNVMLLSSSALKGLSRVRDAMLVGGVIYPLVALVFIWPATQWLGPSGAAFAYLSGTIIAAFSGILLWRSTLSDKMPAVLVKVDEIRASSRSLWVSMIIIRAIQPWAPLFLLGIWASPAEVGLFGAATRIAMLISFLLIAINSVLAPKFAALHKRGETQQIAFLARKFAFLITLISSPAFLIFIFYGDVVMSIFGRDFSSAGHILAILALGQFLNSLTGPVGVILMMGGQEKDMRTLSLISVTVILLLSGLLIPNIGATGAAIATCAGYALTSVVSTVMVWFRFKIWVVPFVPSAANVTSEEK
ncbi:oligosaccharide flippase family protein [Ascidiaceihabitans sp.]|nr:oligosaccharide flippase family protein [Ascidiaceihabitans sp.]